jgi:subtilisin family serine protease
MTGFYTGFTGKSVRVAILDSGVNPRHPHVGAIAGGVEIRPAGTGDNWLDYLGHGTAVAGAIREKAPAAELYAVKIFHQSLATTIDQLARGIEWALDEGMHLINLSLGTPNPQHRDRLASLVERAARQATYIVAAREIDGAPSFPGSLDGVIPVGIDWSLPRHELRFDAGAAVFELRASGYARSIPGVPDERNLRGVSFAVANATGLLARAYEAGPGEVERMLAKLAVD